MKEFSLTGRVYRIRSTDDYEYLRWDVTGNLEEKEISAEATYRNRASAKMKLAGEAQDNGSKWTLSGTLDGNPFKLVLTEA